MIKQFDTDKVLFEARQGDVPFNPNEVFKLFYDGDYSLPLGRVRLFRLDGKIYGRILYYVNLEAYRKHYMQLQNLYPSLTLLENDRKAEKILCCSLNINRNTDTSIQSMGDQLMARKIKASGLNQYREVKTAIDQLPKEVPPGTDSVASVVFLAYQLPCTLFVDIRTRRPLYIIYPGRNGYDRVDIAQ